MIAWETRWGHSGPPKRMLGGAPLGDAKTTSRPSWPTLRRIAAIWPTYRRIAAIVADYRHIAALRANFGTHCGHRGRLMIAWGTCNADWGRSGPGTLEETLRESGTACCIGDTRGDAGGIEDARGLGGGLDGDAEGEDAQVTASDGREDAARNSAAHECGKVGKGSEVGRSRVVANSRARVGAARNFICGFAAVARALVLKGEGRAQVRRGWEGGTELSGRKWSEMVAHASARRESWGKWETERSESAAKRASAWQSAQVCGKKAHKSVGRAWQGAAERTGERRQARLSAWPISDRMGNLQLGPLGATTMHARGNDTNQIVNAGRSRDAAEDARRDIRGIAGGVGGLGAAREGDAGTRIALDPATWVGCDELSAGVVSTSSLGLSGAVAFQLRLQDVLPGRVELLLQERVSALPVVQAFAGHVTSYGASLVLETRQSKVAKGADSTKKVRLETDVVNPTKAVRVGTIPAAGSGGVVTVAAGVIQRYRGRMQWGVVGSLSSSLSLQPLDPWIPGSHASRARAGEDGIETRSSDGIILRVPVTGPNFPDSHTEKEVEKLGQPSAVPFARRSASASVATWREDPKPAQYVVAHANDETLACPSRCCRIASHLAPKHSECSNLPPLGLAEMSSMPSASMRSPARREGESTLCTAGGTLSAPQFTEGTQALRGINTMYRSF
ncbi:hypothetical protein EDB85DRAFT_1895792 [Lactarius pseudohatsudake]|nr:hypothetical protein EDB85DRAFT_1895792 [Lactarius pseudohatsudake]